MVMHKKKVLVTTVNAWSSKSGSDTMSSLMQNYGANYVAGLYIRADLSDSTSAGKYFHIYEGRVLRSILNHKIQTGEYFSPYAICIDNTSKEVNEEKKRYKLKNKNFREIFVLIRELVWILGKWKSKELNSFLDDFKPEVLICPIEGYIHFNRINEYIINKCHPKVIGYLWDDNFTYKQNPNLLHQFHRFWLRKSVRRLIKKCDTVFAISSKMKEEADAEFNVNCQLLTKPIYNKMPFVEYTPATPIHILYTGKLIIGRDLTIVKVVEAIKNINKEKTKIILDIYSDTILSPSMLAKINVEGCCVLHEPVSKSEVIELQTHADVLLFVESLSDKILTARLSFSTKLTDYFSAGKCIWGIGNEDLGPISYLQQEDAGLVSTDEKSIYDALNKIMTPNIIMTYARKAYECGQRNHNAEIILNKLYDAIGNN